MTVWSVPTELPDLRRVGIVGLDTETKDDRLRAGMGSGWPFAAGYICGVSVSYHGDGGIHAHYVPIRHPDSDNFDPAQVYQWLRDLIASDVRIVTQNGLYDWGWLRAEAGIKMPPAERLEEIGALATLIDENRFSYGLDALCKWRGIPGKDESTLKEAAAALGLKKRDKPAAHLWQMPARLVGPYAEQDAIAPLALFENLDPVLDREGTRAAYRLECDLLPMVHEMRWRGIRADLDAAERALNHLLGKRDAALAELSDKLGANVGMAELRSKKWLPATFDQHGIKYPRTEKGNPSFTAGNTGWMPRHKHWLPQLIAAANKYDRAAVSGPCPVQKLIDHTVNGRIHAEINPHRSEDGGTKSFRFSYSDPPLQQMPARDDELAPLFRGIFLPEEGEVWAKPDVSQQEFRLIVHYAAILKLPGAQEALDRYRDDPDTDFHELVAQLSGILRKIAKHANFAKSYGAGVRKFAQMIDKPEREAQEIYDRYDRELPFVAALTEHCKKQADRFGFLELYDGARRHWNAWVPWTDWTKGAGPCSREEAERRIKDPSHPWYRRGSLHRADTRTAMNALIQGSAARHTKLWMRAVWREGIVPLVQMHDCLDLSVSSPEPAERVAQLACDVITLAVPIRVDLKYGRNWGDAKHTWAELHESATIESAPEIDHDRAGFGGIDDDSDDAAPEPVTQADIDEINVGLAREGIEPLGFNRTPQVERAPSIVPESEIEPSSGPAKGGNGAGKPNGDARCRPTSFVVFPDKVMTPSEAAISLAAQGLFVFPVPPNTKRSYKSEKFSGGAKWGMNNDPRQVARDFQRWPRAGVGIPTGAVNGVFVVEADTKEGHDVDGIASLRALEEQHGELPKTRMAISPSGSRHYYFKHPANGVYIKSSDSELAPGVDVRGDGGMVVAPPTLRNDGAYRWLNDFEIADAPQWLLDLILASQARHEQTELEPNDLNASEHVIGDGFDAFGRTAEPIEKVKAALAALDPRKLGHADHVKVACALFSELGDSGGFELLTDWLARFPDYHDTKLAREQWRSIAAKNGYAYRIATLYYLADEADPEWRTRWLDAVFAESAGNGADATPGNDTSPGGNGAGNGGAGTQANGGSAPKGNSAGDSHSEVIEPVDLWGQFDPPPLPTGLLPDVLERFALEEAELTGADPSGIAAAALTVCAAALSDYTQLQVKKHDTHWLESARLWVGLIGNPSTKKTPIILRTAKPLKRLDAELWREYVAACDCYEALSKEERKGVERPKQRRLRLEDTTIEAAQEVLKDSPDGVLVVADELAGWFGAMDKYSGRGAAKDRSFWLQSFHGGPYALNRIARGAAMIENLSVSMLGGIQPEPIRKIAEDTVDDGLLQRLIPIVLRRASAGKDSPTGQAARRYDDLIERLRGRARPLASLQFDDAALAIREELERKHLDLMACEIINRKLAGHIGKYDGLFARLCLLWHCIENDDGLIVTERTARRVADFMRRFLLPHAVAFYAGMLALSDDHDRLARVAGYVLARKLTRITNRDVQRGDRAMRGLERDEIERIFDQLEALGWIIARVAAPYATKPPHRQVNPEVHRRFTERAMREATERAKEQEILQEMFSGGD